MDAQAIAWLWDDAALPAWSGQHAAVIERHVLLRGKDILLRRGQRRTPLPAGLAITPVVHVQLSRVDQPASLAPAQASILQALQQAAGASTSGWVQLDLEARPSQRADYLALVSAARAQLPATIKLSVTALAWWCRAPAWLDPLAADEVVPMFFKMGKDSAALRTLLEHDPQALHPRCRSASAGFSPQEAFAPTVTGRYARTYWFDYKAWK